MPPVVSVRLMVALALCLMTTSPRRDCPSDHQRFRVAVCSSSTRTWALFFSSSTHSTKPFHGCPLGNLAVYQSSSCLFVTAGGRTYKSAVMPVMLRDSDEENVAPAGTGKLMTAEAVEPPSGGADDVARPLQAPRIGKRSAPASARIQGKGTVSRIALVFPMACLSAKVGARLSVLCDQDAGTQQHPLFGMRVRCR